MSRLTVTRRSSIHGNGVFAAGDLPAGRRVIEYRGRLRSQSETEAMYGDSLESGHTFLFNLNDDYVIDGSVDGNSARWINHSCAPNCQAFLLEDPKGDRRRDRIVIETLRPISAGEELTYDYGIILSVRHTPRMKRVWACRCGAETCTGTMLKQKSR